MDPSVLRRECSHHREQEFWSVTSVKPIAGIHGYIIFDTAVSLPITPIPHIALSNRSLLRPKRKTAATSVRPFHQTQNYATTSIPIERAVPLILLIAVSTLDAFRSGIFCVAISRTCFSV